MQGETPLGASGPEHSSWWDACKQDTAQVQYMIEVEVPLDQSHIGPIRFRRFGPIGFWSSSSGDEVSSGHLSLCRTDTPTMLDYKIHAENDSMYNTPPCWPMYICGLVFEKLLKQGGCRITARFVVLTSLAHASVSEAACSR